MINLTNKRFGKWTVIYRKEGDIGSSSPKWICKCDCGTIKEVAGSALRNGTTKSCGCSNNKNLIGNKFGRLLVIKKSEKNKKSCTWWTCLCDCGMIKDIRQDTLIRGCQSCGCLRKENSYKANKKYNNYNTSGEYGIGYTYNTNKEFYFDLEDYDKIKDYCWHENTMSGYINTTNNGKALSFHCLVMDDIYLDHIKGSDTRNDNRKENLRKCTNQQNQWNRIESKTNTSGHKGVTKYSNGMKDYWRGQLTIRDKTYTKSYPILNYGNKEAYRLACEWVEEKDLELHGEFSPYYKHY